MRCLVAIGLFLLSVVGFSQEVKWGRPHQKPDKNLHISQVIGKTSSGIFTLLTDMRSPAILPPVLQCFNLDLKLERQVPLRLDLEQTNLRLETAVILKGRLHLLLSLQDPTLQKLRVYTQEINTQSLQATTVPRLIYEINWEEGLYEENIGFKVSADHSKLLVYNKFPNSNGNWNQKWLLVCDENLSPIWSVEPKIPWVNQSVQLIDYEVNNKGEVVVLAHHQEKNLEHNPIDSKYCTLLYEDKGCKLRWYDFSLGATQPTQIALKLDNKNGLYCGGLLGNRADETNGSFVFSLDLTTGKTQTNIHSFSETELQALEGAPKKLQDFHLRDLHLENNGNISLLAEQFMPPFRGNDQRYYGQVLLVTYPADLSSRKLYNLSKSQVSYDQGYFDSFAYLAKGESHLFLYNDKSKTPMRKACFSSQGAEDAPLEYTGTEKIKVRPGNCAALSSKELWIYAETVDKKQYQIGVIEF